MVFAYPGGSKSELAMITRGKGHDPVAASGRFKVFGFQRTTPELPIVADSFHTKPLLRLLQSADGFQVLALNLQEIKLFERSREVLDPSPLATLHRAPVFFYLDGASRAPTSTSGDWAVWKSGARHSLRTSLVIRPPVIHSTTKIEP